MRRRTRVVFVSLAVVVAAVAVTAAAVAVTSTQSVTFAGCLAGGRITGVSVTATPSCAVSATPVQWPGQAALPSPSATATSASPSPSPSVTATSASPSPSPTTTGITYQAIDGGSSYYCSNGFTYACAAGWDSPSFFPIMDDYSFYPGNSTAAFKDLGLTTTNRVTGDTDLAALQAAGISAVLAGDTGKNAGSETAGGHVEEPGSWADITGQAGSLNSLFGMTGRFYQPAFTWNQFAFGGISGTPCGSTTAATMSCTTGMPSGRHLDIPTADIYWMAGSTQAFFQQNVGPRILGTSGNATPDQLARGSNYGDMVDGMRSWVTAHPAPAAPYIETEDGLVGSNASREITPPEFNWAAWSTIVHGARFLLYFGTTSSFGSGSTFGFSKNVLPGQTVSMYAQAKATDTLAENLAPVLNSDFALNYASVTPGAYVFPSPAAPLGTGIDVMAKHYTGGGFSNPSGTFGAGYYVFASPRGPESQANINAKFTLATGYTGPVTVVGENRTVQASGGQFTDTFATGSTVHIYQAG